MSHSAHCLSAPEQPASRILTHQQRMHWLQGYAGALLRQRLGEAVPAILIPAPLPPAQLALGLDTAAPPTPAQVVQAPGGLISPPEPMPQPEGELSAFDGDAASYASDAASDADTEDFAEWAHEYALAPLTDIIPVIDEAPPVLAAEPVLEGPPAQEPVPPAPREDHLGAACARFIVAPAVFLISTVEACVPAAAPVRGSPSSPACMLCLHSHPCLSRSGSHRPCSGPTNIVICLMLVGTCAGDWPRHHDRRCGRGWHVNAARRLALSAHAACRHRRRLRAHLSRTGRAAGAPGFGEALVQRGGWHWGFKTPQEGWAMHAANVGIHGQQQIFPYTASA